METKRKLHQYLKTYENKNRGDCFMNSQATCPVQIKFCDASAYGRVFSEAIVDYTLRFGLPLAFFQFRGNGPKTLDSYLNGKTDRTLEMSRLEEFIEESK